jgi:hypothetical protein
LTAGEGIRYWGDNSIVQGIGSGAAMTGGFVRRWSVVHKFGAGNVGTSFVPVSRGNIYRTPQPAAATALRVKAGNANDTAAGTGARKITLQGLDETGALVEEELSAAGTSASSATSATFIRLFRAFVSESGTYATASGGSHAADIVIENAAGTEDWATISSTGFARSQTEIGAYTVPLGYRAFIGSYTVFTDSTKSTDFLMFRRSSILRAEAPYAAMRILLESSGAAGQEGEVFNTPLGPFGELTDIGFMAKVSTSTGDVDVDFEILLEEL